MNEDDIITLQGKLGIPKSGDWDSPTVAALIKFQAARGILPTGLPDPMTLTTLGLYGVPKEKHGSGLWRDLVTSGNQIPQIGWFAIALGFVGLAYAAYRRQNPRSKVR